MARTRSVVAGHPRNGRFRQPGVQHGKIHPGFRLRRRPAARKPLRTEGQPFGDRTCGQGPERVGGSGCELDQQSQRLAATDLQPGGQGALRKPVAPCDSRQQLPARPGPSLSTGLSADARRVYRAHRPPGHASAASPISWPETAASASSSNRDSFPPRAPSGPWRSKKLFNVQQTEIQPL